MFVCFYQRSFFSLEKNQIGNTLSHVNRIEIHGHPVCGLKIDAIKFVTFETSRRTSARKINTRACRIKLRPIFREVS